MCVCVDIDECLLNGTCVNSDCINMNGTFSCGNCFDGFERTGSNKNPCSEFSNTECNDNNTRVWSLVFVVVVFCLFFCFCFLFVFVFCFVFVGFLFFILISIIQQFAL